MIVQETGFGRSLTGSGSWGKLLTGGSEVALPEPVGGGRLNWRKAISWVRCGRVSGWQRLREISSSS